MEGVTKSQIDIAGPLTAALIEPFLLGIALLLIAAIVLGALR
ncbi:hypothetical protein [Erythrobacter donghaensis]|nr:hypothetical protein [Erythrobacter donghaensis]